MMNLFLINFNKKLSFISVIFMLISLIAIYMVTIYNASFNLDNFLFISERKMYCFEFFNETFQLIELIQVIFIILLVELELFYNTDNFDSYFVSLEGKKKYFRSKIITYIVIIFFYTLLVFLGVVLIYLIRFQDIEHLNFIIKIFIHYLLYFMVIFGVSFLFLLMFRNYFSAMLVFIYYWISQMIEVKSNILKVLLARVVLNVEEQSISFGVGILYVIVFLIVLFLSLDLIYQNSDLKINS